MTDDLRTRIAAVLYERFATAMSFADADAEWENVEQECWLEDADAVIRALGLTQQYLFDGIISDGEPRPWEVPYETRYVTEWVADE